MKKTFNLLGIVFVSVLCLTGCKGGDDSSKYNINIDADKNIEVKTYVDYEKEDLIVYLTNNNSYNIASFDIEAIFYDEEGNQIGHDYDIGLGFISGGNYIAFIDLPEDEDYNGYVPNKIDLSVKVDQDYQSMFEEETLYNDKIITSYKEIDDEIEVNITNNSEVELFTVEVAILFIKNDRPIYADWISKELSARESTSEMINIPEDWEKSEKLDRDVLIDYDSIEIVVNSAIAD